MQIMQTNIYNKKTDQASQNIPKQNETNSEDAILGDISNEKWTQTLLLEYFQHI